MMLGKHQDLELFDEDGYHPNPTGSYLSACVIYATLFGKRLEGAPLPEDVPRESGQRVQSAVQEWLERDPE